MDHCCNYDDIPAGKPDNPDRIKKAEHDKHRGHTLEMFSRKFWLSLILTIPVVLYSELPRKLFGFEAPEFSILNFQFSIIVPFILGSIVFFYGGWVFIAGAWRELKDKTPGMMTLIALAISTAFLYSVYAIFNAPEHTLFWELTTLITIMLLGHWMEMKAVQGTQSALKELAKLLPDKAEIMRGDKTEIVSLEELKINDIVFVRPGGKIPADGIVIEGQSDVNESMITGESTPVIKKANSEVIAGSINGDGSLKIKIVKIGENTFLAGVMRLVAEAQTSKSRLQLLSDRAAFYLTIIAIISAILTLVVWLAAKSEFSFALERLVAVLVVACPHALGLAIPLVASISTAMAARNGFLVRQRIALETARNIDVALFDKTGTLTKGEYGVGKIFNFQSSIFSEDKIVQLAASVDAHSEHFIAKAIVKEAKKRKLNFLEIINFKRIAGKGTFGIMDGNEIFVGGEAILAETGISLESDFKKFAESAGQGETVIYVIKNKKLLGAIALADVIREESREAIKNLKSIGIKVAMITGDSEEAAKLVSKELDIDEYYARVLPQEKSEKVKILQNRGLKVAMIGDGINDAPALTQADLGIAIGAGTNVAIESAGIILARNDPRDIAKIIKLSRLTYAKMIQNLFWATGYNIVALPLAAGVLSFKGVILQPALAALFMSLSTIIVAVNAILLKNKTL